MSTHAPDRRWTDHDLERFHDGELPEPERTVLSDDLRASPGLRERLSRVAHLDGIALKALASPAMAGAARSESPRPGLPTVAFGVLAAAACLAIAALVALLIAGGHGAPPTIPDGLAENAAPAGPTRSGAVRVVLSLPVIAPAPPHSVDIDAALARGEISKAATALASTDRRTRDAHFRRVGEVIRSAANAQDLLDALSAADQLAACRVWADDPRLRPAAFARLERLRSYEDLAEQYKAVITEFSTRPELNSWVRSYLHAAPSERPATRSS